VEVLYPKACGLDVHKATVVACAIIAGKRSTRTFGSTTSQLLELANWLDDLGVTAVAMESTGVYWKPVYNVLELIPLEALMVVNAQHIKKVPGRKTDASDAEWIADLLRHGLLRPSLIPTRDLRELRELVRYRKSLVEATSSETNRIQKVLEGANLKLSSVVSDVKGKSGRAILKAIVDGVEDPERLAELALGRLKSKKAQLREALVGVVHEHQKAMLRMILSHVEHLEGLIAKVDEEIEGRLREDRDPLERLDTIPGVGRQAAVVMMATFGRHVDNFPSAAHLASWAGLCPGQNESAGKRKSGRTRQGMKMLKVSLIECARAAARGKGTYLASQYRRLAARLGGKRAAVAVAHSILTIAYYILKNGTVYEDLGENYFEERDRDRVTRAAVRRLRRLGHEVILRPAA